MYPKTSSHLSWHCFELLIPLRLALCARREALADKDVVLAAVAVTFAQPSWNARPMIDLWDPHSSFQKTEVL